MSRPKGIKKLERDKFMSKAEIGALLHAAREIEKTPPAYAFFAIQYILGLRVGEGCLLRYDHLGPLDTRGFPMYVNVPTLKKRLRHAAGQPGTLPVPVLGSPALVKWIFTRDWRESEHRRSQWLFPGRNPRLPMSTKTAISWFHALGDTAGLRPQLTPHALRHSAATYLSDRVGDRVRLITAFLRHTPGSGFAGGGDGTAAVTQRYLHVADEMWRRPEYQGALDVPALKPMPLQLRAR